MRSTARTSLRVGVGYDVHRFSPSRRLMLGGIELPHSQGLEGYSDADVLLHAICDAILGAAALGDIGQHFPAGDARYRGVASIVLLREVVTLTRQRGYRVGNVDAVVVAEAPRISPHVDAMRATIAEALGTTVEDVSVKATTNERLGFVGRGEGIAAQAVVLLELVS
ncbi:MAG: 2-C-methyl-D-erythritol 2,4-cyclodiphosphate synthase [Chloroflexi bacterium]|nr:2-C-methyl-D-erythritol 2,4-cyclodiphosphate synthase [Chloroflexota bacterium]